MSVVSLLSSSSVWSAGFVENVTAYFSLLAAVGTGGSVVVNTVRRDPERAKKILCYTAVSGTYCTLMILNINPRGIGYLSIDLLSSNTRLHLTAHEMILSSWSGSH